MYYIAFSWCIVHMYCDSVMVRKGLTSPWVDWRGFSDYGIVSTYILGSDCVIDLQRLTGGASLIVSTYILGDCVIDLH